MDKLSPEVVVFVCNWDGWSCVDTAANIGLCYPTSVKLVKVNCLSRIHIGLILKAFDLGAEGVMLLGCEKERCHFGADSKYIVNEYERTRNILEMLGVRKNRLALARLPAYDGRQFVNEITKLTDEIARIPPSKRSRIIHSRPNEDVQVKGHP